MDKALERRSPKRHGLTKLSAAPGVPLNCQLNYGSAKLIYVETHEDASRKGVLGSSKVELKHSGYIVAASDATSPVPINVWELVRSPHRAAQRYGGPLPPTISTGLLTAFFWSMLFNLNPIFTIFLVIMGGTVFFKRWQDQIIHQATIEDAATTFLSITTSSTKTGEKVVDLHDTSSMVKPAQQHHDIRNNGIILRIMENNPQLWKDVLAHDKLWQMLGSTKNTKAPVMQIREVAAKLDNSAEVEMALLSLFLVQFHKEFLDEELDKLDELLWHLQETLDAEWQSREAARAQTELFAGGVADTESAQRSITEHADFALGDLIARSKGEIEVNTFVSRELSEKYGIAAPEVPSLVATPAQKARDRELMWSPFPLANPSASEEGDAEPTLEDAEVAEFENVTLVLSDVDAVIGEDTEVEMGRCHLCGDTDTDYCPIINCPCKLGATEDTSIHPAHNGTRLQKIDLEGEESNTGRG